MLWKFADEGQAVAERNNDALHGGVGGNEVVKGEDSLGLGILGVQAFSRRFYYVSVPEGVVRQDEAARTDTRQYGSVVVDIVTLVGIDEDEVEGFTI